MSKEVNVQIPENQEIRYVLLEELKLSRMYKELVPRPPESDRQLLKESIAAHGFDLSHPLVLNEDMLLLDGYTRQEIAQERSLKWVPVVFRDYGSPEAEQEFVILSNLARRHFNSAQRSEMGLKLLEIEEKKARDRQQAGGDQGRLHRLLLSQVCTHESGETLDCSEESPETQNPSGVGLGPQRSEASSKDYSSGTVKGKAIELAAARVGVSHNTLRQAKVIVEAAKTDPEVAKDWEEAKAGKKKVKTVYAKVKSWREERKEHQRRMDEEDLALQVPREELVETFREVARIKKMPMDAVEALMETDPQFLQVWKHIRLGLVTLTVGWCVIYWKIHVWLRAQRGLEPDKEYRRKIFLEMKKSCIVFLMQFALRLLNIDKAPEIMVELLTGIDRKLFPSMRAWEDRLDLLAEPLRVRSRIRPEVAERARVLWQKGKKDEYRNLITLSIMGDFNKKLLKEEEQERQRFGRK